MKSHSTALARFSTFVFILSILAFTRATGQQPGVGPQSSYPLPAPGPNVIYINAGGTDVIQTVQAQNPGKTYVLRSGTHKITSSITLRSNEKLLGEYGAILSGSQTAGPWTLLPDPDNWWYLPNRTRPPRVIATQNPEDPYPHEPDHPFAGYPDDLFRGLNVYREKVNWEVEVDVNEFSFEWQGGNFGTYWIRSSTNPNNLNPPLQFCTTDRAIIVDWYAVNVVIGNLVIEGFRTGPNQGGGAVALLWDGEFPGAGAIVENCDVRINHGAGIETGGNLHILRKNYIRLNGQFGITGQADQVINNELAWNGVEGYSSSFGAGGTKFMWCTGGMLVQGNYSHHNYGPGFWSDIENRNHTYRWNICEYNNLHGIFYEIGVDGRPPESSSLIDRNICRKNGINPNMVFDYSVYAWVPAHPFSVERAGILVWDSANVTVTNNIADRNRGDGIGCVRGDRGVAGVRRFRSVGNTVKPLHGNLDGNSEWYPFAWSAANALINWSSTSTPDIWNNELLYGGNVPFQNDVYYATSGARAGGPGAGQWWGDGSIWHTIASWEALNGTSNEQRLNTTEETDPTVQSLSCSGSGTSFTITANGVNGTGSTIKFVRFLLDNIPQGADDTSSPYSRTMTGVAAGVHAVRVLVVDNSGNSGLSLTYRLDAPQGTFGPAFGPTLVANAYYELEPAHAPGMRLDHDVANANAIIWGDHSGPNQRWKAIDAGSGWWQFEPESGPGFRLNAAGAFDGADINVAAANGGTGQKWRLIDAGGGVFQLEPQVAPGRGMDVAGGGTAWGTDVLLWIIHGGDNQKWRFHLQN
jgi:hypothetical protein